MTKEQSEEFLQIIQNFLKDNGYDTEIDVWFDIWPMLICRLCRNTLINTYSNRFVAMTGIGYPNQAICFDIFSQTVFDDIRSIVNRHFSDYHPINTITSPISIVY